MRTTFNEKIALQLYNSGKNDTQIARVVGKKPNTIAQWRHRNNLPVNIGKLADGTYQTGDHYRDVLEPGQVDDMSMFLIHLLRAGKKAVRAGVKPDVMGFMEVYAGRTKMWAEERRCGIREEMAR